MKQYLGAATDPAGDGASLGAAVTGDTLRLPLKHAARVYDRHEAGRREPYNVFSVLRSDHDQVNLHSRYLVALLNHRKSLGRSRKNLADFLQRLEISGFDHAGASMVCERNKIDLMVRDQSSMQGVISENKISAADQPRQLARYAKQMREHDRHVLYLTLNNREALEYSTGGIRFRCSSYKTDRARWLKGCE